MTTVFHCVRSGSGASVMPNTFSICVSKPACMIALGRLVDRAEIERRDDAFRPHVAEQSDLASFVIGNGMGRAAQKHIGLDTDGTQFLHRMLGRLGLQLARRFDVGHQRQMNKSRAVVAQLVAQLPDCFEERQALDVADRAADLDKEEIDIVVSAITNSLMASVTWGMT